MTPEESSQAVTDQGDAPTVFLSYSHDTKEHKAWVGSLAQRLVQAGVNVLFDQWDLGPGDDVPKFMEQAVAKADRVLMVCSEIYVRKADDGKGGVGYEAMIVTGELVHDLGTNKFIPIIRQTNPPTVLPRCVGTRLFVDLSEHANADENFELLLREIHNVPKVQKPPLGKNPFSAGEFDGPKTKIAKETRRLEFSETLAQPEASYNRALEIINANDRVAWRKLLLAASEQGSKALTQWRTDKPDIPPISSDQPNNPEWPARFTHVQSGVECFSPLIACLVAAAETGKEGYADQLGWVESVLEPSGYAMSGGIFYHASFPQTIFYVTQALVGGMLMLSGMGEAAYKLGTTKISDQHGSQDARPLFEMTRFNGWPDTLAHSALVGWMFLNSLIDSWDWLTTAFGSKQECRAGISSYYQILSFLNFVQLTKDGQIDIEQVWGRRLQISVSQCYCAWPEKDVENGYKMFLNQKHNLKRVLEANGLDNDAFEAAWPKWINKVYGWLGGVYGIRANMRIPQAGLPNDLKHDPFTIR
jgi:TIR domain